MFLVSCGALVNRFDPDMNLYVRKTLNFKFPVKFFKQFLKTNPQYGSNQAGIERNSAEEARYVRITDIDEYGNLKDNLGVTAEIVEDKYVLNHNDLLFARSGATVGKVYLHKTLNTNYSCFYAGYMIRFVVDDTQLLPDYVFCYTQLDVYKEWTKAIQRAAGQPNINAEEYKSLPIPIPPLSAQTEIVQLFAQAYESKKAKEAEAKRLLEGIDAYLLEKLGIISPEKVESKKSFFVKFSQVQGKRFDPFYHKTEFEENIEVVKSGQYKAEPLKLLVRKLIKGKLPKDQEKEGVCKVVQINSIRENGNIDIDDLLTAKEIFMPEQKMQKNDVLVVITGATIGKIAIWEQQKSENYFLGGDIVKFQCLTNVNPHYIFAWLRFKNSQIEIKRNVTGATNGHLSPSDVGNILIPIPPLSLQTEIAEHIQGVRAEAKRLENEAKDEVMKAKKEVERMILGV